MDEAVKCDSVHKMVAIASGKGGVGKSTLAANLGIALGQMRQQVCLFDADANLANINILFGVNPEFTLQDCLNGSRKLNEIMVPVSERLQIVPAASGIAEFIELSNEQQQRLVDGLTDVEQQSDVILVDSAAGIGNCQLNFFLAAACSILVITPEPTSLTDAFSFLKVARRVGFRRTVHVIINHAPDLYSARAAFKRFKGAAEKYLQLEVGYLGYVLQDRLVPESVKQQRPVLLHKPESLASRCVRVIAERLLRLLDSDAGKEGGLAEYLQEMNHPFGLELSSSELNSPTEQQAEEEQAWLNQVLERLPELDDTRLQLISGSVKRELSGRKRGVKVGSEQTENATAEDRESVAVPEQPSESRPNGCGNLEGDAEVELRSDPQSVALKTNHAEEGGHDYSSAVEFAKLLGRLEAGQVRRG